MSGKMLGSRYRIVNPLSKGGFGTTYLAEDTQYPDNLQCVVKKLHSSNDNADNEEFQALARRMFAKEAQTLAKLGKHEQIPQLLAYFEEEGEFYLVQEYVQGSTLANELMTGQPWPETKVVSFLQDLLNILHFVHQSGVIHRDIKPDNIIRRANDNKLVLVDFGTVKEVILSPTEANALTVSVGTQGYMPTEQARGKPRFASDIYAVGMIAVQALTGSHPLELPEDEMGETVWQPQANCSDRLHKILAKMIRYHFKERYHSAQEILGNLGFAAPSQRATPGRISDVTAIISPSSRPDPNLPPLNSPANTPTAIASPEELPRQSKGKLGLIIGGIALAGGLLGGGIFWLSGQEPEALKQAQEKALDGDYAEAIALVSSLTPTEEIQSKIDTWSARLLERAETKYIEQGDIEAAARIIQEQIPNASPYKQKAQQLLSGWQQEHNFNQSIMLIAKEELQQKRWQEAKNEAAKIKGNTPYWQAQTAKIIEAAELGTESAPGVLDICAQAPDLC